MLSTGQNLKFPEKWLLGMPLRDYLDCVNREEMFCQLWAAPFPRLRARAVQERRKLIKQAGSMGILASLVALDCGHEVT